MNTGCVDSFLALGSTLSITLADLAKFKANLELRDLVHNLALSCKQDVCISAVSCSQDKVLLCLSSLSAICSSA